MMDDDYADDGFESDGGSNEKLLGQQAHHKNKGLGFGSQRDQALGKTMQKKRTAVA